MGRDGEYYVRIPGVTYEAMRGALAVVRRLPQVDYAFAFMNGDNDDGAPPPPGSRCPKPAKPPSHAQLRLTPFASLVGTAYRSAVAIETRA